jgi:hypothetical protein
MFLSSAYLILVLLYLLFLGFIIVTIIICLRAGRERCRNLFSETMLVISEVMYTVIGPIIGFMRFDEFGSDIPFAKHHVFSVIIITISSSLFFWISRISMKAPNPLLRIFVSVGLLQGIFFCFITSVHFLAFIPLGVIYPLLGFELVSPLIALLLLIKQFYFYTKVQFDYSEQLPYRNELGFVPVPVKIMESPAFTRFVVFAALVIPMILAQVAFAYGCGQDANALLEAFRDSHGFIFSVR